jgi:SAM-dependent methyltransferase
MAHPSPRTDTNPFLWPQLRDLPYFRALLRAVEADFYRHFELTAPILDVGCGDGQFASVVFEQPIDVGFDPFIPSLREAKKYGVYRGLAQSLGDRTPFPDAHFGSAFSNSVLEHISELQTVLNETGRVLRPGALFLFCVPNHRWPDNLSISTFFKRVGLQGLARAYVRFFTRVSRHVNMLSPEDWQARLKAAGFALEDHWHYFPPAALHALEWGHYFGLPSWVARGLTRRWVIAPYRWNLALTERLIRKHASGGADPAGTYTWFLARKLH